MSFISGNPPIRQDGPASGAMHLWRDFWIVVGLTCCLQFGLYGSSFLGLRVLSPVNILTRPGLYLPQTSTGEPIPGYHRSDLVQGAEENRWFLAAEYRAGRIPLWTPYQFSGTPTARSTIFSPFELLNAVWPSPLVLPWIQLASALAAAIGMWLLAAKILKLGSIASITAGTAYPMTGFMVLWQGFNLPYSAALLPWGVLASQAILIQPAWRRVITLAIATALLLISGPVDLSGQILLVIGFAWVWSATSQWISTRNWKPVFYAAVLTSIGWGLGFLLAAPSLLPLLEYTQSSARIQSRSEGKEVRPPVGWKALPLIAFPEAYGTEQDDTVFLLEKSGNRLESAAAGYGGCLALLFAVPLAWLDRQRRAWVWMLTAIAILGLSWQLNIPGLVDLWRLPVLRLLSANRMAFASAWSILLLAVIGIQQLPLTATRSIRWPLCLGVGLILTMLLYCVFGLLLWPGEIRRIVPYGMPGLPLIDLQNWFTNQHWSQLGWCLLALAGSAVLVWGKPQRSWWPAVVGACVVLDLTSHVWNLHPQPAWKYYFPRLPALEFIQKSPPGRVLAMNCLPPNLLESHQLRDIRGYDGVDPLSMLEVLQIGQDVSRSLNFEYAKTMWYIPAIRESEEKGGVFRIHPVLDMLSTRYLVVEESVPLPKTAFRGDGYSIFVNERALPHIWVPKHVAKLPSEKDVLAAMTPWEFKPALQAFVTELPVDLPQECSGEVELTAENPIELVFSARMATAGLAVIGDRYDPGWKATVDGEPAPVLCVNHVLRGVELTPGNHVVKLYYRPASFVRGVQMMFAAFAILFLIGIADLIWRRTHRVKVDALHSSPT